MVVKSAEPPPAADDVDEAGMDSFPASDPPSFWARGMETSTTGPPGDKEREK